MSLIQDTPRFDWDAGQRQRLTCAPVLPTGRSLAEFDSFVLTVRADPSFPALRSYYAADPDPYGESWDVIASVNGTRASETVTFDFNAPTLPGSRRYVVDAWAVGGTVGPVRLLKPTWVSVSPTCRVS